MVQTSTPLTRLTSFSFEPTKKIGEHEIVENLKKGCHKTFTYLYENYHTTLYGIILDFIEDRNLAKDVLQDVFLNIYKKINTYDETKSRLFTWMVTVTRHLCIDKLKSKSARNASKTDAITEKDGIVVVGPLPRLDHIGIYKLLDKVKPSHKKLIELSYYKGYSNIEISQLLQIPVSTVKTRIRTALIQLRQHMQS